MEAKSAGLLLIAIAVVLAAVGVALMLGLLGWFGRLPGDVHIERDNLHVYAPIASMLVISLVLSIALALFGRLR
jgi:hypothetical protein